MLEEKSAKVEGLRRKFFWLYIIAALACILAATVVSLALISANKAESKAPAGNENNSPATKAPVVETSNPNEGGNTVLPPDTNTKEPTTDEKPIVIPEGATTVGDQAFYNCTAVAALNLPASLTEIGEWAFNPIVRELPDEAITVVADSVAAKYVKQFRP